MKKTLIIILTTSFISSQLASNEIYKTNNESVYLNLLSRSECVRGPNINKPGWVCNEKAPKGWAEFYGEKLKKLKNKGKKFARN